MDVEGPLERHRIGYPSDSPLSFFQPFEPAEGRDTCASVALSRMIHARGISDVVVVEPPMQSVLAHILKRLWISIWLGTEHVAAEQSHARTATAPFGAASWDEVLDAVERCWGTEST